MRNHKYYIRITRITIFSLFTWRHLWMVLITKYKQYVPWSSNLPIIIVHISKKLQRWGHVTIEVIFIWCGRSLKAIHQGEAHDENRQPSEPLFILHRRPLLTNDLTGLCTGIYIPHVRWYLSAFGGDEYVEILSKGSVDMIPSYVLSV